MTPYTSFVAIEERKEGEDLRPTGPSILELVEKESVDILPYIDWENRVGEESEVCFILSPQNTVSFFHPKI